MISDTRIRKNSMEWTVGNPSLKPSSRYENWVVFSFSKPRINTDFTLNYRINRHCDLAKYTRTENDQFLYSQTNQPHCNMLYLTNDTRFDIIPDHLIFSVNAGIYRFSIRAMSTVIVIPLIIIVEHYRDIGENGL